MDAHRDKLALIGFGEAGQAFAPGLRGIVQAYDIKTDEAATRPAKLADYARANVRPADSAQAAVTGANLIASLVTADQALVVAEQTASHIAPGALYCDFNSVAPDTKRAAATAIEAVGAHYVDVAVMAPVDPARISTPLLLSGPQAQEAAERFAALGFANLRVVGDRVSQASAIKMIRSVMVKGIEALTAECFLAATEAGVADEVLHSLDASNPGCDWAARADYNLDRMLVHGRRRAAEMGEVVKTLEALGQSATMSRATAERQHNLGALDITAPPAGLAAKVGAIVRKTRTGASTA